MRPAQSFGMLICVFINKSTNVHLIFCIISISFWVVQVWMHERIQTKYAALHRINFFVCLESIEILWISKYSKFDVKCRTQNCLWKYQVFNQKVCSCEWRSFTWKFVKIAWKSCMYNIHLKSTSILHINGDICF